MDRAVRELARRGYRNLNPEERDQLILKSVRSRFRIVCRPYDIYELFERAHALGLANHVRVGFLVSTGMIRSLNLWIASIWECPLGHRLAISGEHNPLTHYPCGGRLRKLGTRVFHRSNFSNCGHTHLRFKQAMECAKRWARAILIQKILTEMKAEIGDSFKLFKTETLNERSNLTQVILHTRPQSRRSRASRSYETFDS